MWARLKRAILASWREWRREPGKRRKVPPSLEIENLSIAGTTWRFSPAGFIVLAETYLDTARTAPLGKNNFNPARTFLAGHSIELGLKAFLSLNGASLVELAGGPFGHRLDLLLEEAEKIGLNQSVALSKEQAEAIRFASHYYSNKILEYPALSEAVRAYPKMPNTDLLISAAGALVLGLKQRCIEAA